MALQAELDLFSKQPLQAEKLLQKYNQENFDARIISLVIMQL